MLAPMRLTWCRLVPVLCLLMTVCMLLPLLCRTWLQLAGLVMALVSMVKWVLLLVGISRCSALVASSGMLLQSISIRVLLGIFGTVRVIVRLALRCLFRNIYVRLVLLTVVCIVLVRRLRMMRTCVVLSVCVALSMRCSTGAFVIGTSIPGSVECTCPFLLVVSTTMRSGVVRVTGGSCWSL